MGSVDATTGGTLAALGSSATWAYATTRYALASRDVSPIRVNLARMLVSLPIFLGLGLATGSLGRGLTSASLGWLGLSTLCSYALADNLFFAAARRLGVSSALAIASTYPLWAAVKSRNSSSPASVARPPQAELVDAFTS